MEKRKPGSGKMIIISAAKGKQTFISNYSRQFLYSHLKGEHIEGPRRGHQGQNTFAEQLLTHPPPLKFSDFSSKKLY